MNKFAIYISFLLIVFSLHISCRKEGKKPSWDVEALLPLLETELSVQHIISDSILTSEDDSSITLSFNSNFYTFTIDSLFTYPDTNLPYIAKLDCLVLEDRVIDTAITLYDLAYQSDPLFAAFLAAMHGDSMVVPAIDPISTGETDIDATEYFETMTLKEGYMDFEIVNGLSIDLTNVQFELKNEVAQNVITAQNYDTIKAGTTKLVTVDLAGETVEGLLVSELLNIESPGSNGELILIDTSEALIVTITLRDLLPYEATALFPAQDVVNKVDYIPFRGIDFQLNSILVRSGNIRITAVNTLPQELFFNYKIPSATLNGDTFSVETVIPAATASGSSSLDEEYSFAGYTLDLTMGKNGDTVNVMKQVLIGSLEESKEIIHITLEDSIFINTALLDIVPDYAEGYLGNDTLTFGPASVATELFNKISGDIDFEDLNITLDVVNGIGASAAIVFDELSSVNSTYGNTVSLSGTTIKQPFEIQAAEDNPLTETYQVLELNDANTNNTATAFIENLPDNLNYFLSIMINPGIAPPPIGMGTDFIYYDSGLEANLNVSLPLSLIANKLKLSDTLNFNMSAGEEVDNIIDGTLTIKTTNGFPFEAEIKLYLFNEIGELTDSLLANQYIASAKIDANQKVSEAVSSSLRVYMDKDRIKNLYDTKKIAVQATFSTPQTQQYIKIYDYYGLSVQLLSNFNYNIQ